MNQKQTQMLRQIAYSPRELFSFKAMGTLGLSTRVAQTYLSDMMDSGYIECDARGRYTATDLGRSFLANRPEVAESCLWGAWSTPAGSYVPPTWRSTRPGADDHRQYQSRGV